MCIRKLDVLKRVEIFHNLPLAPTDHRPVPTDFGDYNSTEELEQLMFDKIKLMSTGNQSDQDASPASIFGVRLERSCLCSRAACDV